MELSEAQRIINGNHGYLVHFEHYGDGMLRGDYFPDVNSGERPFESKKEAEETGRKFACATKGKTCNFYLVRGDNFKPIGEWRLSNQ